MKQERDERFLSFLYDLVRDTTDKTFYIDDFGFIKNSEPTEAEIEKLYDLFFPHIKNIVELYYKQEIVNYKKAN